MQMMSVLAKIGWNGFLTRALILTDEDFVTEIGIYPIPRGSELAADIAVSSLYEIGVAIAEHNKFYQLEAALTVNDVGRALLRISNKTPEAPSNITSVVETMTVNNSVITLMGDRGSVVDPQDNKFIINFTFDGVRLKSRDIFTSFLNAFAISSQHLSTELNAYIPAAPSAIYRGGLGGDVILSTWATIGPGDAKMSWARLKRALLLIWSRIVLDGGLNIESHRPRFEGFKFTMDHDGRQIGAGALTKIDSASNGTHAVAVAR